MRICTPHWDLCREVVAAHGLASLGAKSSEEAMLVIEHQLAGLSKPDNPKEFDPLMSLHWHFMNEALRCGGIYLMHPAPNGSNDGHYCPICEFEKHQADFKPKEAINSVVSQMAAWCRDQGLIPKLA